MSNTSNAPTRYSAKLPAGTAAAAAGAPPASAPPQPGDQVQIFRIKAFYRPEIEGSAVVIAAIPGTPGVFYVRFDGESRLQRRQVLSGIFQSFPEFALEVLQTAWRAGVAMDSTAFLLARVELLNDNQREG